MLRGDSVPSFKHDRVTPAQIIILGFLLLIFTGAVLLMLPFSTQEPGGASFGDALFTAHFRHLCDRTGAPRYGALLVTLWAAGHSSADPGGRNGSGHHRGGDFHVCGQTDRVEAAVGDAGVHFRPSGGRHRADDGVYPKNRLFDRRGRGPASGPAVLPAIWSWKRTLVRGVSLSVRVLQCGL